MGTLRSVSHVTDAKSDVDGFLQIQDGTGNEMRRRTVLTMPDG